MDATSRVEIVLTPGGRLVLSPSEDGVPLDPATAGPLLAAFADGTGPGLLRLGAGEVGTALPAVLSYWREFAARYVTAVCSAPEAADGGERGGGIRVPAPAADDLAPLALAAPPMRGAEYVTPDLLAALWRQIDGAFMAALADSGRSVTELLKTFHPAWNLVGRVHFHLAENRKDPDRPFAFMATYTTRLSAHARAQHLPLGQALREYAGAASRGKLLSLLVPVNNAAESCPWVRAMVESNEVFHPLRWTPREAVRMLRDAPALEAAGVVVRMPATWRAGRPSKAVAKATIGGNRPSKLGTDGVLDFHLDVAIDGEPLTEAEVRDLLRATDGLALVRGGWVEVDPDRLQRAIDRLREVERVARAEGLSFADAMRLLAGAGPDAGGEEDEDGTGRWAEVAAGPWLRETLAGLRTPEGLSAVDPGAALRGTLRPYQQVGVRWLHLVSRLGLGACLADDMGLGKTIQVLSLLLVRKARGETGGRPSLLVAPASLLANWVAEAGRFAPDLRCLVAHPSAMPAADLKSPRDGVLSGADLVITSYGALLRVPWLASTGWDLIAADEAQAVKNPDAKQTRALKKLSGRARLALTGTPVENRLSDLWSLFDFINPGLLGSAREFTAFSKRLADRKHNAYAPLRDLVRPYVLRRMKTDKAVISDLPDKTEVKAFCPLTRRQAVLYEQAVRELAEQLDGADGIRRKGVVLAALMRFKQVCNHPSQWLGDGAWAEADSGKLARLREIAEVVASRQEKVLLFTQFREATAPLAAFLGGVFGRPGLVLHGETAVSKRADLVRRFQEDESVPFFVLSLKAGGSGLNLTAASHVVHFDRWWNPAVENQATDRAFRIGQTRNVLVHKFVCRGTVEEKIDALIESKRQLSRDVLEGGGEAMLTEMSDDELMRLVALDVRTAMQEA
ncbi:MAG: DEAD/DEAH box helicase [Deltaproteobacteria bacterium]|nr:DEAD/DEAH box helicase [Deltaproteobacteria bacterium]